MKKLAKAIVVAILASQVRRLRKRHGFKVIALAGSIGKTSSKLAIADVLETKFRTLRQQGNYNDPVSVPLVFFGREMPSLFNPLAWLMVFLQNERKIRREFPYDVVVTEIGADGPGQLQAFKKFLRADLGILTAIAPEHMEFFKDLKAVAREELIVSELADKFLYNKDLCPAEYMTNTQGAVTYGIKQPADFNIAAAQFSGFEGSFDVLHEGKRLFRAEHEHITEPQLYSVAAAATVAVELGMAPAEIERGLQNIKPVSGRMQRLDGVNGSLIIDDTYNASPEATKAALQTLYRLNGKPKIAILGNMNELGEYSKSAHEEIGRECDPAKLDLVVTIGPDANQYLAAQAEARGCRVERFDNPSKAGQFIKENLKDSGAVVLAKGSQNRVFAEEAVKVLLADPADSAKLVRQSAKWMKAKKDLLSK